MVEDPVPVAVEYVALVRTISVTTLLITIVLKPSLQWHYPVPFNLNQILIHLIT